MWKEAINNNASMPFLCPNIRHLRSLMAINHFYTCSILNLIPYWSEFRFFRRRCLLRGKMKSTGRMRRPATGGSLTVVVAMAALQVVLLATLTASQENDLFQCSEGESTV